MKTQVRTITPEVAQEMLTKNYNNRKLNKTHVRFLKNQMKNGLWVFDGQPIRFDKSGRLLDGQHRLNAVLESGVSNDFLVVSGLSSDTFEVMDTGKNRSASDVLSMSGAAYSCDISAVAKNVHSINIKHFSHGVKADTLTNKQVLRWYDDNKNVEDCIRTADILCKKFNKVISRSDITTFIHLFNERNVIDSEIFMRKLCTGLDLRETSPIYALRNRLISNKVSKYKITKKEKFALIIKSWNSFRKGEDVKRLAFYESEKFPVII